MLKALTNGALSGERTGKCARRRKASSCFASCLGARGAVHLQRTSQSQTSTPSCKTLGGSAELAADPAKFCLAHRQMRAEGILRYIDIE